MSYLIFNDGNIKGRLIKNDSNWFVGEWKYTDDKDIHGNPQYTGCLSEKDTDLKNIWLPWIAGTSEYLQLTQQEKNWAKICK